MEYHCILNLVYTIVLFSLVPQLAYATDAPCEFSAIFNFGDSNSDTGGYAAAFGQFPWPNGESFLNAPASRLCDGRLIIDFIAESLVKPYISAFLDALGSNFTHGANFATVGSTIRHPNSTRVSPFSLHVQRDQFKDLKRRSQLISNQGGVYEGLLPKADDFSHALYTFDIGENDLGLGLFLGMTTDQIRATVPDMLNQFKTVMKDIYDLGGRTFWIHNTGPSGCLPSILDNMLLTAAQVDRVGCASSINELSKYFNTKLKEAVNQLRKDLPLAFLIYVDVYAVKYELIRNAKRHGFLNPLRACCGHGGKYNYNVNIKCGNKIKVKGKETVVARSCKDPSVSIIWDGVHFTQAGNKWVFDQIVNGDYSDPPVPLRMACNLHN